MAVILQHMGSKARYSIATNDQLAHAKTYVEGAVLCFFLISGYLHRQPTLGLDYQSTFRYAQDKFLRLIVPFFLVSIIDTFSLRVLGKITLSEGMHLTLILHGASMQLYFLPFLYLVSVGFHLFLCLSVANNIEPRRVLIPILVICAATSTLWTSTPSTGGDLRLLPLYLLAYCLGAAIRCNPSNGIAWREFSFGLALCFVMSYFGDIRYHDVAAALIAFTIARLVSKALPKVKLPGSGGVYLFHTPIINFAVSTALLSLGFTEGSNIAVSIIVTYFICLAMTLAYIKALPSYRWLILE